MVREQVPKDDLQRFLKNSALLLNSFLLAEAAVARARVLMRARQLALPALF
jgi:hypothetical protein